MSILKKYLEGSTPYKNNTQLGTSKGYILKNSDPRKTPLATSFDKTSLDVENPKPFGGPINDPVSGFKQIFSNKNKYFSYIKKFR
jgi:hypothetical protein